MQFNVIQRDAPLPPSGVSSAYLRIDRWDDWGKYRTQFMLYIFDGNSKFHEVGEVKIGCRGLRPGSAVAPGVRAPHLDQEFIELPEGYFSLGQGENYYEVLATLSVAERSAILNALRDIAYDLPLFESFQNEEVMHESLLRYVSAVNVRTRLHRLAMGDATLSRYAFKYIFPDSESLHSPPPIADFIVEPESVPPTNVHVIIGRNGVGKTRFMQGLGRSLLGFSHDEDDDPVGTLVFEGDQDILNPQAGFSGLVSMSFSAFDDFQIPTADSGVACHTVGLRRSASVSNEQLEKAIDQSAKTPDQLADDFCLSFASCRNGLRRDRWENAVFQLYNDPVFSDANPLGLLEYDESEWKERSHHYFKKRLSSGHKIVLLSITKLVELVDERTLVLLDEPEGHLHPPLLAAFVRSLSDLLIKRNGVAIIATHSPVVLQEVPAMCVSILERTGLISQVARPQLETFGENVGRLTREVFGLEVTHSGFHRMLKEASNSANSMAELVSHFDGRIGAEGLAIARGMMLRKNGGTL